MPAMLFWFFAFAASILALLVAAMFVQGWRFRVAVERMGERLHTSLEEQRHMTIELFQTISRRLDVDTRGAQVAMGERRPTPPPSVVHPSDKPFPTDATQSKSPA